MVTLYVDGSLSQQEGTKLSPIWLYAMQVKLDFAIFQDFIN
jgi:hypothetical protein